MLYQAEDLDDSTDPQISTFNSLSLSTRFHVDGDIVRRDDAGALDGAIEKVFVGDRLYVVRDGWGTYDETGYDSTTLPDNTFDVIAYDDGDFSTTHPYAVTGSPSEAWRYEKVVSGSDLQLQVTHVKDIGQTSEYTDKSLFERIAVGGIDTGWKVSSKHDGSKYTLIKDLYWEEFGTSPDDYLLETIAYYDNRGASPKLISKTITKKEEFVIDEWVDTQVTEVYPGEADRITKWNYNTTTGDLESVEYPDGSWVYYASSTTRYLPWKDVTLADAIAEGANSGCKVVVTSTNGDTTTTVNGVVISQTEEVSDSETWTYTDLTHYLASSSSEGTYVSSDGTVTTTFEEEGWWENNAFTTSEPSTSPVEAIQRTTKRGTMVSLNGVEGETTWSRSVSVDGDVVMSQLLIYENATSQPVVQTTRYTTDYGTAGLRKEITTLCNASEATGRIISEEIYDEVTNQLVQYIDEAGVSTVYTYDFYDRMATETRAGVTTTYHYDPHDRIEGTTITGGALTLTTATTYHPTGEIATQTDTSGLTTEYSYSVDGLTGGEIMTVTRPDGSTEITKYYLDGQVKSITGTGVVHRYYEYSVDGTSGNRITKELIGSLGSPRWNEREIDWAGRIVEERRPAYSGGNYVTSYTYQAGSGNTTTNLITKIERTGVSPMIFEYNELGIRERQGIDLDTGNDLDENSAEPLTESTRSYVKISGEWYEENVTKRWLTDDSATSTQISKTLRQLTGLPATTVSKVTYTDANNQEMVVTTTVNRSTQTITETTDLPDSTEDAVRVTVNGLLTFSTDPRIPAAEDADTVYGYDDLNRLSTITDPKGEVTTQTYYPGTNQLKTIEPPVGAYTEFAYYEQNEAGAGQVKTRFLREPTTGATINQIDYVYDAHGRLIRESGSGTYPVAYGYDPTYGDRTTLTTYRDGVTPDVTTWEYQPSTGLLTRKKYADENGTDYTYYDSGQLHTREWARGVTTTYTYDATGNLLKTEYDDGATPTIDWDFNRASRLVGVNDVAGEHTLSYTSDGQLAFHSVAADGSDDILDGFMLLNSYNSFGQRTDLDVSFDSTSLSEQGFTYDDATGRLQNVTFSSNFNSHTAAYTYKPNTHLVETLTHSIETLSHYNGPGDILSVKKSYDELDRVTQLAYGVPHEHFGIAYVYNAAGQRKFAVKPNGDYWHYQYDAMGQVTSATKHLADKTSIPGYGFGYGYDTIGNRLSASRDGDPDRLQEYYAGAGATGDQGANAVNQYGSRSVPRVLGVLGTVNENATVSVNGVSATQTGDYFQALLDYSGESSPNAARYESVTITGTYAGQGAGGVDAIAEVETDAYLPANPQNFTYDDDGNLTGDGRWTYTWNGENRLIAMEPTDPDAAIALGLPGQKLEFAYDYQGRRVQKAIKNWNSGASAWDASPTESLRFFYDGWNLIVEVDQYDNELREHVWGLDLAQDLRATGGVGALLATADPSGTYYAAYDGNGNITAMVDSLTAAPVAEYEYGPFGQPLRKSGALAAELPFGFSTKYTDAESELVYYGYRYYDAKLGRWPSRDPIGELGGINLYLCNENNSINIFDILGLTSRTSVVEGIAYYTWHMGWLDQSHYQIGGSLTDAWNKISAAKQGDRIVFNLEMLPGTLNPLSYRFCIKVKGQQKDRKNQLLSAWVKLSMHFEEGQGSFFQNLLTPAWGVFKGENGKVASTFSSEDLVSNLIKFYATVDGVDPESLITSHAGRLQMPLNDLLNKGYTNETARQFQLYETMHYSLEIWDAGFKVIPGWKRWYPRYPDLETLKSALGETTYDYYLRMYGAPKFPEYFNTYQPDDEGVLYKVN